MYCKKCGKEISNESLYCPFCGEKQVQKEMDAIMPFLRQEKKKVICFSCWIILNTIFYLVIGNPNEEDFIPHHSGFGPLTYIVCTFLAPSLLLAFREGIKYLQIHSTMNANIIKIISLIIGLIPVFFLVFSLFLILLTIIVCSFDFASVHDAIITIDIILAIIGVVIFYRDLFKTKK